MRIVFLTHTKAGRGLIVEADAMERDPAERSMALWLVMLRIESAEPEP
jgi:hypothetical protein